MILERLNQLDPDMKSKEEVLKANHLFFKLLVAEFERHSDLVENVNRSTGCETINADTINKINFGTFMKQPQNWRDVR